MDYKDTPIIINNFNRVTTTRIMCEHLWELGYHNIYILDNQSTYPPLREWYDKVRGLLKIEYLDHNYMQNAIFDCGILKRFKGVYDWIAYTDSDLTLNEFLPANFIERLVELSNKYGIKKAGLALKIDDLPDTEWGNRNRKWEKKFWLHELEENVYNGQIDTTFSIWNPHSGLAYSAIRVAGDFTATHEPWYTNFTNLNEEESYYLEHSHPYSTYKRAYLELTNQTV